MKLHRKPWKVINQPLRPGMARIIEVQDADGRAVIPWTGFDALDGTKKEKLALAKEIIEAVNARADNKALLDAAKDQRRKLWFDEWRPIINAIGELSVQEAMDAIERDL